MGGTYLLAASSLAAGIGVAAESIAPYESNEGTSDPDDDWSLPEQYRFTQSLEFHTPRFSLFSFSENLFR